MKIDQVEVFVADLPTKGGRYRRPHGGYADEYYTTYIVKVHTDDGISGHGEICTMGSEALCGFTEGALAGIPVLARHLLGENPLHVERLGRLMDTLFRGSAYLKTPIDVALWDIRGKKFGVPVSDLLGGSYGRPVPLYRTVHAFEEHGDDASSWRQRLKHYRSEGHKYFQLKTGVDTEADIAKIEALCDELRPGEYCLADANTQWTLSAAIRVASAVRHLPVILEQPCATMEECAEVRRHWPNQMALDELMESTHDVMRGYRAGAMDIVKIKISRVGGLTKALKMRDLCVDLGLAVVPEDMWGSEIATSAALHLATSTDPKYLFCTTDSTEVVDLRTCTGFPDRVDGHLTASTDSGLGVYPIGDVLGNPVAVISN
nr:enolase C-terminal domain-like protein [Mesorhizobium sp. WSM4875]